MEVIFVWIFRALSSLHMSCLFLLALLVLESYNFLTSLAGIPCLAVYSLNFPQHELSYHSCLLTVAAYQFLFLPLLFISISFISQYSPGRR